MPAESAGILFEQARFDETNGYIRVIVAHRRARNAVEDCTLACSEIAPPLLSVEYDARFLPLSSARTLFSVAPPYLRQVLGFALDLGKETVACADIRVRREEPHALRSILQAKGL